MLRALSICLLVMTALPALAFDKTNMGMNGRSYAVNSYEADDYGYADAVAALGEALGTTVTCEQVLNVPGGFDQSQLNYGGVCTGEGGKRQMACVNTSTGVKDMKDYKGKTPGVYEVAKFVIGKCAEKKGK